MSYLRAFLVRCFTLGFESESEDWHEKHSTAQMWRWYEESRR
ncbi:hypothetical protein [Streptomyces sp. NPDC056670]